ncbi:hypothetical protein ACGFXC_36650 [Streptomyces sp. NPDC048507]|uniref:hypothetical protein n=1 Tax=Streptomyces sp. NPDC048507 TaxID=3365560 RepID=UPI0037130C68
MQLGGKACTVGELLWSDPIKESDGVEFVAPDGKVIVGREHKGDEMGKTRYCYADLLAPSGSKLTVTPGEWTALERENSHSAQAPADHILVGRVHQGDERGRTRYLFGTVK